MGGVVAAGVAAAAIAIETARRVCGGTMYWARPTLIGMPWCATRVG